MEKEFVPYELAVKLKALGFDEPCFLAFDNCSTPMRCSDLRTNEQKFNGVNYNSSSYTSQPTFSQAFRWFREKHQIFPEVLTDCTTEPKFVYTYNTFYGNPKDLTEKEWGWENNIGQYSDLYRTYEEAELACLEKLIEIVEPKSE